MAIDAVTMIGNNIRIRMGVSSLLIATRSFLAFLESRYGYSQIIDDTDSWNTRSDAESKYGLETGMSATFALFFWSGVVLIILMMGYGDSMNPNKKLNVWIRRIVGLFIIGSTGTSIYVIYGSGKDSITPSWLWLPASCLLAYDVQYV